MRILGKFGRNNCEENLRIFLVNFENISNFGKDIEETLHKF